MPVEEIHLSLVPGAVSLPFEGLPTTWVVLFCIAFAAVIGMLIWTTLLFVRGQRLHQPEPIGDGGFLWVFLVPALNEEVTIADSVRRLTEIGAARRRIVVIDDGSDDRTPEVLAGIDADGLTVLRREPPSARQGKAAALNWAYRQLDGVVADTPREQVIVCVVDADGRLDPVAPSFAAAHFAEPSVGGLQLLVRIYNRRSLLAYMQDVEFAVYGRLYQAGRSDWGTAGMGGNGQFNRLSALDDVADHVGPWRDRLTEDQDLGLRLMIAGWDGRQELRCTIEQQGLSDLRRLYRQRTRWSQGNLQAMGLAGPLWRSSIPAIPRIEQTAYLLLPFIQGLIGFTLVVSLFLAIFGGVDYWAGQRVWQLVFFYLLGFGGTILGCLARGRPNGLAGLLTGFLVAQPYAFYTWILWPVLIRSSLRQLTEKRDWDKTEREPIEQRLA